MKKTLLSGSLVAILGITACTDHEIIPPPVPLVDIECLCEGSIETLTGDSTFTYDDTCTYSSTKTISTTTLSDAQYQTQMLNSGMNQGFEIEMRNLYWTDEGSNQPTSTDWQAFFNNAVTNSPNYSTNPVDDGVVIRWTDQNNKVWVSDTTIDCISNFTYNLFTYDSDTTGEYMEFDAVFNCRMINSDYGVIDSARCLTNAHMKSAFRLD
jgi:hypothetical protein